MTAAVDIRIEKGRIVRNRTKARSLVTNAKDGNYFMKLEKIHATRSKAQNDYYHSVVVARIAAHWEKSNDPDTVHAILKAVHLPHDLALSGANGTLMNGYVIGGSTTRLNKLQFIEYLESIVMWAAERGIHIPDPDPLWRQHAEEEAQKGAQHDAA